MEITLLHFQRGLPKGLFSTILAGKPSAKMDSRTALILWVSPPSLHSVRDIYFS
jgi:hypothetical protein